jgi:hypothetical protein
LERGDAYREMLAWSDEVAGWGTRARWLPRERILACVSAKSPDILRDVPTWEGGTDMLKRLLVGIAFTVPMVMPSTAAHAIQPSGGCPVAFQGPYDFATVVALFPPPEGVDPIPPLTALDANMNGQLCVRGLPGGRVNALDDRLPPR